MDKMECRRKFGLPENKKLIGYSGSSLIKKRGLDILFESFSVLKQEIPDLELVLTGRKGRDIKIPSEVNWLGYLPDENMPALMNSLDALVVINPPTAFGNYSYPVKLYEAMRCQTPVVVTKTMSTQEIMRDTPQLLVESGSAQGLGEKIKFVLDQKKAVYPVQNSWDTIGERLETLLVKYTVN
jgi:glycosyltransferase involved in cell wall biosynthesis